MKPLAGPRGKRNLLTVDSTSHQTSPLLRAGGGFLPKKTKLLEFATYTFISWYGSVVNNASKVMKSDLFTSAIIPGKKFFTGWNACALNLPRGCTFGFEWHTNMH